MNSRRAYASPLRATRAAETESRMLDAAEKLFMSELFDRVTLAAIADEADVTIPTIQRRFGDKEGIFMAAGLRVRDRVVAQRGTPPSTRSAAMRQLMEHYETEGHWVWHFLRQEADVPTLRMPLSQGRKKHREWVEAVFAKELEGLGAGARRKLVDALYAATDVCTWKLLRIDFKRTRAETHATMEAMVDAIAKGAT